MIEKIAWQMVWISSSLSYLMTKKIARQMVIESESKWDDNEVEEGLVLSREAMEEQVKQVVI